MEKEMFLFYKSALQGALASPLCADYKAEWRACGDDKEKLVNLVMRQQSLPYFITHCHKGVGLSKQYILDNFKDYINGKGVIQDADGVKGYTYGIYIDFKGIFTPKFDVLAFMWCSNTHVTIQAAKCPILYCGCNTHIHLSLDGFNSVFIYLFDDSKVTITDADENSKVVIYEYSDDASVELGKYCLADVKEFNKKLRL